MSERIPPQSQAAAMKAFRRDFARSEYSASLAFWASPESYLEPYQLAALLHRFDESTVEDWQVSPVTVKAPWVEEHSTIAAVGGGWLLVMSRKRCLERPLDAIAVALLSTTRQGVWLRVAGNHPDLPIELLVSASLARRLGAVDADSVTRPATRQLGADDGESRRGK